MRNLLLFVLLFCYTFAFYIGEFSISLLMAVPLYGYGMVDRGYKHDLLTVFNNHYIKRVFKSWWILTVLSLLFPVLFLTFDLSLFRVVIMQFFHLLATIPVFAYLKNKRYTNEQVLTMFVLIFVVQTIIQCIVVSNETLGEWILYFNHFQPEKVLGAGSNIRGKALSAATTYHLSLVYGVGFIIYIKEFLSQKISLLNILIGILIFVGIFFTGRTGFVGVIIGLIAFGLSKEIEIFRKIKFVCLLLLLLLVMVVLLSIVMPEFYLFLEEQVFPYAFEFIYSMDKSGQMETASTNHLKEMWHKEFDYIEFLIGSGKYSNEDGSYYMRVDPGILRHLLFMGIGGYLFLIVYQLVLLPFWKMNKKTCFYYGLILIYFFIMDFKGCTIGVNKFAFSASLLLSFSYFELTPKTDFHKRLDKHHYLL